MYLVPGTWRVAASTPGLSRRVGGGVFHRLGDVHRMLRGGHVRALDVHTGGVLEEFTREHRGVVTREEAISCGITDGKIEANIAAGRWVRLFPGVYFTFNGQLPRDAWLWAVLL